jgi:hypothetical protein
MAWGARQAERVHLENKYPVNLMGVDGTWRRSCVLVDVSATGARLEVDGSLEVLKAQEFFLILSSTGLAEAVLGMCQRKGAHDTIDKSPAMLANPGSNFWR